MLKMNDLTDNLSRTWEAVSQGWVHLINRAESALTHFRSDERSDKEIPALSPRWGLINVDLFDDDEKLIVKLEVPGLEIDDLDISVFDKVLTVRGEKRFQSEQTKGEYRVLECAYGSFSRSIPLAYDVDTESAKASYDKGVLKVELNKQPHQRRLQIKVN
jgi:HSP20 family protein